MKIFNSAVLTAAFGLALLGGASDASAFALAPGTGAMVSTMTDANVQQVRMSGRFGHRGGGGFGGGDGLGVGIGIGILGGLLLDNALNNGYYSDGNCAQRFRSYDPRSETYLGNDGRRHHCS